MTKVGLYAIGKFTTLESNKSQLPLQRQLEIDTPRFTGSPVSLYSEPYQEAEDVTGLSDSRGDICHAPVGTHAARY